MIHEVETRIDFLAGKYASLEFRLSGDTSCFSVPTSVFVRSAKSSGSILDTLEASQGTLSTNLV